MAIIFNIITSFTTWEVFYFHLLHHGPEWHPTPCGRRGEGGPEVSCHHLDQEGAIAEAQGDSNC